MKNSHSEIWMHLVLSTKNNKPVFGLKEIPIINLALKDFGDQHEKNAVTYSVLPEHIHILIKLPENMSLNGLVSHLQTFIKRRLGLSTESDINFEWNKDFHAHSVSLARLSDEKSFILRQELKHQEMTFEEELKFLGL
jgi:putative transposase